ncbi:T9SS type A sorting domain-containing protein [candidate division KSB1 bacterium]
MCDVSGREVAELLNCSMNAGYHSVTFKAENLPSGVYIYKIKAGKFIGVKRMILMK